MAISTFETLPQKDVHFLFLLIYIASCLPRSHYLPRSTSEKTSMVVTLLGGWAKNPSMESSPKDTQEMGRPYSVAVSIKRRYCCVVYQRRTPLGHRESCQAPPS